MILGKPSLISSDPEGVLPGSKIIIMAIPAFGHRNVLLMFDLPPEIAPLCDLAKMKAAYELIEPLTKAFDFSIIKETRGGVPKQRQLGTAEDCHG